MICNKTKIIIIIIPIDIAAAENHDNPKFNSKYVHIPYKEVYAQATIIVGSYTYFFVIICFGRIIIAINIIKPITACID